MIGSLRAIDGRDGEAPLIVRLPTLREEAAAVADHLSAAHSEGHAWADMAILCRRWSVWTCAPTCWPGVACHTTCAKKPANSTPATTASR